MAGLAEAILGAVGQPASVRVGTVESVSPLTVTAQGVPFNDVGVVATYTPQVGDTVVLLGQSSEAGSDPASWLVLGATDTDFATLQAGSTNISFAVQTSATVAITFPTPFSTTPSVACNINNGTASAANWHSRAISVTTTGFTMFVFGPSSTWVAVNVQWQAQAQTR